MVTCAAPWHSHAARRETSWHAFQSTRSYPADFSCIFIFLLLLCLTCVFSSAQCSSLPGPNSHLSFRIPSLKALSPARLARGLLWPMLPFVSASLHFQQGALGGDQDGNQVFPGIRLAQRKPQEMFQWINSLNEEVGKSVQLKTLGVQHSSDLRFPKAQPSCPGSRWPPGVTTACLISAEATLPPSGIHGWKDHCFH